LGPLAIKEIKLPWGVKDEVEKLKDTVFMIKDVLLDAEEQQVKRHAVRNWLKKLEDTMYEANNLLDDFSTEALLRKMMTHDKMEKKARYSETLNSLELGFFYRENLNIYYSFLDLYLIISRQYERVFVPLSLSLSNLSFLRNIINAPCVIRSSDIREFSKTLTSRFAYKRITS
jgi:predicted DNA-binding protein YlxM (UPF0122 family)